MKYWVYKESRILGPFDKEGVSGLSGLDSGTLVCAGDPAGGGWIPAEELGALGITARSAMVFDEPPSTVGLMDQLQIDASGLIGDDDLSGAFAEDLFQDAALKKSFGDILSSPAPTDDGEIRRARDKITELTAQLEVMYRHISELEVGQIDLARRLAAKDLELRARGVTDGAQALLSPAPDAAAPEPAKTFLSPAPEPKPGGPPPVEAVPDMAPPSPEWPAIPAASAFPSFSGAPAVPPAAVTPPAPVLPAMPAFSFSPPPVVSPSDSLLPDIMLSDVPVPEAPAAAALPVIASEPIVAERVPLEFGKPKSFKLVPTTKSFKILGAEEAAPSVVQNPVAQFKVEPIPEAPVQVPPAAAVEPIPMPVVVTSAPMPVLAPVSLQPAPEMPTFTPAALTPTPAPDTSSFPTIVASPFAPPAPAPAIPTPFSQPPNTLSTFQQDVAVPGDEASSMPPATLARTGDAVPADDGTAARFAKPELVPATGEVKKPGRSNKSFLIAGGVLVTLLMVVGVIFMRQPKDDFKQMTALDDGQAPIGLAADDGAEAPPPIVKPKMAPPPVEAPPPPGPSAEHLAAIANVKDFPLDGDRGTVGRWLQYSYTADQNAGSEEWNASTTGDDTVLVEYRLVPGAAGGKGALYLFETDANGLVMGKNLEARQMLAGGGPRPEAPAVKKSAKRPAAKRAPKRRPVIEEPKEVPLLPLPDAGELRPPAEDDGTFGSDTVNQGI